MDRLTQEKEYPEVCKKSLEIPCIYKCISRTDETCFVGEEANHIGTASSISIEIMALQCFSYMARNKLQKKKILLFLFTL